MNTEQNSAFLIRVPVDGCCETAAIPEHHITDETLAGLLNTDVTERLILSVAPPVITAQNSALCYFIDARGGDRALPANFYGTCFYHTGCPIYGDLLLAKCSPDTKQTAVNGFTEAEAKAVIEWLHAQFPHIPTEI